MADFLELALNLLFPIDESCMFCRKRRPNLKHCLCSSCVSALDADFYSCKYCGVWLKDRSFGLCDNCAGGSKAMDGFVQSYLLDDTVKRAIYRYKNGKKRELSYCLASIIEERVRATLNPRGIDLIVPVPTSKKKLRQRGFDHIADIAEKLSASLQIPYEPLLGRSHEGGEQKALDKLRRLENMKGAFYLKKYTASSINILLVDDILTTGATMESCAKVLHQLDCNIYGVCAFHAPAQDISNL